MLNDNHKMILGTTETLIILFTTYLLNIVKILPLLQSRIYVCNNRSYPTTHISTTLNLNYIQNFTQRN